MYLSAYKSKEELLTIMNLITSFGQFFTINQLIAR